MPCRIPRRAIRSLIIRFLVSTSKPPRTIFKRFPGIHGRPYTSWDNVGPGVNAPLTGYCTHGECSPVARITILTYADSVLFPSWHRPYLVLYEVHHPPPHHSPSNALPSKSSQVTYRPLPARIPAPTLKPTKPPRTTSASRTGIGRLCLGCPMSSMLPW